MGPEPRGSAAAAGLGPLTEERAVLERLSGAQWGVLAVAAAGAVLLLVRLMRAYRNQLMTDLRDEADRQARRDTP